MLLDPLLARGDGGQLEQRRRLRREPAPEQRRGEREARGACAEEHFCARSCATRREHDAPAELTRSGAVMPTTRAPRRASAARQLLELPADALGLVLYHQLTLAHDIAAVAPTCRLLCDVCEAGALKLRPFSAEVVTLRWHTDVLGFVAAALGQGTGSDDKNNQGVASSLRAHYPPAQNVVSGRWRCCRAGARFVSGGRRHDVKLWTLDGTARAHLLVGGPDAAPWSRRCPTACTSWSALPAGSRRDMAVPYRVDARHTFKGYEDPDNG